MGPGLTNTQSHICFGEHRSENFGGTQRTEGQESGEKGERGVV